MVVLIVALLVVACDADARQPSAPPTAPAPPTPAVPTSPPAPTPTPTSSASPTASPTSPVETHGTAGPGRWVSVDGAGYVSGEPMVTTSPSGSVLFLEAPFALGSEGCAYRRGDQPSFAAILSAGAISALPRPPGTLGGPAIAALADGTFMVASGADDPEHPSRETALLDPATARWTPGPQIATGRLAPLAIGLPDGRVLLAGGWVFSKQDGVVSLDPTRETELLDRNRTSWQPGPPLPFGDVTAHALLGTGRVLVIDAGDDGPLGSLFDPSTDTWQPIEVTPLVQENVNAPPPMILGLDAAPDGSAILTVMLDDADSESHPVGVFRFVDGHGWTELGTLRARGYAMVAVLPSGDLFAAGSDVFNAAGDARTLPQAELFDVSSGRSRPLAKMPLVRMGGVAVALPDGSVIVIGGSAVRPDRQGTTYCVRPESRVIRWIPTP